jgi:hypothetical protein
MSNISNTGTGSGNNSNTSKWGWSGSTLGSASGGPRSGNPFNPLPGGKFGNSMPGDKTGRGTKLALGAGAAGLLILANNADVPVVQPTPYTGYSENSPRGRENLGGGNGVGSKDAINIASKEVLVNDVKQKEGNKTLEQIGLLTLTNIGGRELTKLSRHNEINGINQQYSPIANLADISLQYSPLDISPNADNVSSFLSTFSLDIVKYIPTQQELDEYYPLEADIDKRKIVLFDKEANSLIVHVKNIFTNEKIEVEFMVPRK